MPSPFIFSLTDTSDDQLNLGKLEDEIESSSIGRKPTNSIAIKDATTGLWSFELTFSPDLSAGEESTLPGVVGAHLGTETVQEEAETTQVTESEVGSANGVASLDSGGKIPASQIPAVALPQVYVVADSAARLALSPNEGDEAIQTDDGSNWIWDGSAWQVRPTGSGDVVGPGSASNNAIPLFDGATGKTLKAGQTTEDGAGNLLTVGNVNGRNLSTDGAKLDGIEAGATADQSATEVPFSPNGDISASNVQAALVEVRDDADTKLSGKLDTSHEGAGGAVHADATTGTSGFMSAADKAKLDGIETGAEANDVDSVFGRTGAVVAQASDYDADQVDYNNGTSGLAATDVQAAIDEIVSGAGGAEDAEYFSAGDTAGGTTIGTSWVDIPLGSQFQVDSPFSHTPGSAEVTVNKTGILLMIADVSTRVQSGNNRSQCEMRVLQNGSEIPGTRGAMYAREVNEGSGTASASRALSVTSGDVIKMQAERVSGSSNTQTLPNGSRLTLVFVQGPKGDPGAGGVELQNDGAPVAGGPFTTVNVVGALIQAADAGSGVATLTATPEKFFQKSDPEQTNGGTTLQAAVTLNFTATGGTYALKWYAEVKNDTINSYTRCSVNLDGTDIGFADVFIGDDITIETPFCGFDELALAAGPHTLTLNFAVGSGGQARIRRCRLRVKKES